MISKLSILIKVLIVIAFFAWLVNISQEKINAKIIEDIKVVSHNTIYAEKGYPVYTNKVEISDVAYFITDITLDGNNNAKNHYTAFVSQDKANTIKVGNNVYVPKTEDTLRTGFSWEDTSKYNIGKVISVSSSADWKTGFYQIKIDLEEELPKQPFYSAKVVNATKKNIVVLPIANLDSINGTYHAWLEDENLKAVQKLIKTGICDGYNCEVISGVNAGDTIITSDRKLLTEGMLLNNRGENK